jgi:hypothetical protein
VNYQEFPALPEFAFGERDAAGKPINDRAWPPKWFNPNPPPAKGARVRANFNRLGFAVVTGYFVEENFLGLLVRFEDPPEFFKKQNRVNKGHLFGPEFDLKGVLL